jgi:hypothetical protein
MGWAVGYDGNWDRDVGYGVPAICDHPDCGAEINRGLSYVCGGDAYGGEKGCGLFFCEQHLWFGPRNDDPFLCRRCLDGQPAFQPTPDTAEWTTWKLTDPSWAQWRAENGIVA